MNQAEDPIVIVLARERVRKVGRVGIGAAVCCAVVVSSLVAVGTNAPLWSAAGAEFVLRWAIAIGLVAASFAALYWGVRA